MHPFALILFLFLNLSLHAKENECEEGVLAHPSPAMELGTHLLKEGLVTAVIGRDFVEASSRVDAHMSVFAGDKPLSIDRKFRVFIHKIQKTGKLHFTVKLSTSIHKPFFPGQILEIDYLARDAAKYPVSLGSIKRIDRPHVRKSKDGTYRAEMAMTYQQSENEEAEDAIFYVAVVLRTMWLRLPAL